MSEWIKKVNIRHFVHTLSAVRILRPFVAVKMKSGARLYTLNNMFRYNVSSRTEAGQNPFQLGDTSDWYVSPESYTDWSANIKLIWYEFVV